MRIPHGSERPAGPRPRLPAGKPEEVSRPAETSREEGVGPAGEAPAPSSASRNSSPALEKLRKTVGVVSGDRETAALRLVGGLLRAELGPAVAEEPGFEQMVAAVAEKILQDPVLGDALKRVLGELARP